jgi:hypothetical protein
MARHATAQHGMTWHGTAWHDMARHSMAWTLPCALVRVKCGSFQQADQSVIQLQTGQQLVQQSEQCAVLSGLALQPVVAGLYGSDVITHVAKLEVKHLGGGDAFM